MYSRDDAIILSDGWYVVVDGEFVKVNSYNLV